MKKVFEITCSILFTVCVFFLGAWTAVSFLIYTEASTFIGVAIAALAAVGFGIVGFLARGPYSEKDREMGKMKMAFYIAFICLFAVSVFFLGAWTAVVFLVNAKAITFLCVAIAALVIAGFGIMGYFARGKRSKYLS